MKTHDCGATIMKRQSAFSKSVFPAGFLCGLLVAAIGRTPLGANAQAASPAQPPGVCVASFCAAFAQQYAEDNGLDLLDGSYRVAPKSDWLMRLSNVFQPSDSRFTAGYDCRFTTSSAEDPVAGYSVDLLLANTLAFAEQTKWERLQLVPITYLVDEARKRSGYGVFKYLKETDDRLADEFETALDKTEVTFRCLSPRRPEDKSRPPKPTQPKP